MLIYRRGLSSTAALRNNTMEKRILVRGGMTQGKRKGKKRSHPITQKKMMWAGRDIPSFSVVMLCFC